MITQVVQITQEEIVAKFKSLDAFKKQLEKEAYILPDVTDLSWDYVISCVAGEKKLLKKSDIPNFTLPSR